MPIIVLEGGTVERTDPPTTRVEKTNGLPAGWITAQVFENKTGVMICDLIVETLGAAGPAGGAGPGIQSVTGELIQPGGASGGQICSNPSVGGAHEVHLNFNPGVATGGTFKLDIKVDPDFKTGERLRYTPTDDKGAPIA